MPDRADPVWNLRESKQARSQLDKLAADARFEQIWASVRWLIIRNPIEASRLVPGKKQTYAIKTRDFMVIGMPEIIVAYSLIDIKKRVLEVIDILPIVNNQATSGATVKPSTKSA